MTTSRPRPERFDVLIAAVGLCCGLLLWMLGVHTQVGRPLGGPWLLLPLAVTAGQELVRRTHPRTALTVGALALVMDQLTLGSLATVLMFTDLVYAGVLYGKPNAARRIPVGAGLFSVAVTVAFVTWFRTPQALLVGVAVGLVCFAPATTGVLVRNHRDAADSARLRADQTALLAEMDRVQAVAAERARMARELHDMVANHLSAIAIHATAALSLNEPAASTDALAVIRENSVAGLAEMRRLIGLLRDESGSQELSAAPTLNGLSKLLATARANGLNITLKDARRAGEGLPAPVELAAYRLVQESLTNAAKHASAGPVRVLLDRQAEALVLRITSPYGERQAGPRAPGSGSGLAGMRERATLLNGWFAAGPEAAADGRVWTVHAVLPINEGGAP